ncbi:MAG: dihydroorotate dehydrogenase electron transfer subunit [Clostridia bacterium]|nr:dihydroorotate dehydrogenase electron transfer subunit [Clostridia bacterium]
MKQSFFEIVENTPLTKTVYRMRLVGDTSDITASGQFVNIKLDGFFLRRPISVCDVEGDTLTLVYKVVGKGTEAMSKMTEGTLDVLTGLGNGYDLSKSGDTPVLVGGGVGVPPLYLLCRRLLAVGKRPSVILGFNTREEIFYEEEFRALGVEVSVATVDGSYGTRGFVTDCLSLPAHKNATYFYTCGPEPMLKALCKATTISGQLSFEERMGCGFGACMGCSCQTLTGNKRICKEGPVLEKEELLWNAN